jgi:hypothetical protein
MALNFPNSPVDGQLYPNPAIPGAQQYVWNADKGTWLTVFNGIQSVNALAPLFKAGTDTNPAIGIFPATATDPGYLSAEDKRKLDNLPDTAGTVSSVKAGVGLGAPTSSGQEITDSGTLNLLPATFSTIGGIRPVSGVRVDETGALSLTPPANQQIGGVKQGNGVAISSDGTLSIAPTGTFSLLDPISFNSSTVTFPLTVGGNPFLPSSANALLIFIGGVFQIPNIAFTTSAGTITFTEAPAAGLSFYGISLT